MIASILRAARRTLPALLIGLAPAVAGAQGITGLWSTGVDGAGNPMAVGSTDTHYQVIENGFSQGIVYVHPSYVNDANSTWIWQTSNGQPGNTIRTFRTTFTVNAGYDPTTAFLNGRWSTDNFGLDILINGISTGWTAAGFTGFTPFSITSGFVSGTNTLDFRVQDVGPPGALNVTDMSGNAQLAAVVTPEPSSVILLATGFLGLGIVRLRRRA